MWDVRWRKICWHGSLRKFYNSGLHRGAKDARQQVIFFLHLDRLVKRYEKTLPAAGLWFVSLIRITIGGDSLIRSLEGRCG
jgi:hypothetical protein